MRADFPEFFRWQNAMRPEDTGFHDGRHAAEEGEVQARHFELKVSNHLGSRLGVVRNNFAEEEQQLWARYLRARSAFQRLCAAQASHPGSVGIAHRAPLAAGIALAVSTVAALALLALLGFMFDRHSVPWEMAIVLSVAVSVGLVAASHFLGVIALRSQQNGLRIGCAVGAATIACALLWAFASLPAVELDSAQRWLLGLSSVLCCLAVGLVAFHAHDRDPHATRLDRQLVETHAELADLIGRRRENSTFHLNVAQRHRELALQMLSLYRQAYRHAAAGMSIPTRFDNDPKLEEVDASWFVPHEEDAI